MEMDKDVIDLAEEAYLSGLNEQEEEQQLVYNSMCENLFAEMARQWLDQNGARILADVMDSRKTPVKKRSVLSNEKVPVQPWGY